jgi:hypothetical protein
VTGEALKSVSTPPNLWRFVLVKADIPPTQRSGLAWDDDGSPPDPYLKLLVEGRLVWESPRIDDNLHPPFDASPEGNLAVARDAVIRLELWDKDAGSSQPIGIYQGRGAREAIMGANTNIKLEGGATVTIRVDKALPLAGTGIAQYELRKHAVLVLKVVPNSPASRAGVAVGDRITAIDGKQIDELGEHGAASALALAGQNGSELTLQKDGQYRQVKLDEGYVWLSL